MHVCKCAERELIDQLTDFLFDCSAFALNGLLEWWMNYPIKLFQQVDDELEIKAYYAGHVLGAAMFHIKVGQHSFVYTVSASFLLLFVCLHVWCLFLMFLQVLLLHTFI